MSVVATEPEIVSGLALALPGSESDGAATATPPYVKDMGAELGEIS